MRPFPLKKVLPGAAASLAAAASFVLRLPHIGRLSMWMDEGFYFLAAQKILEHGYPLYPSGHVLFKGILFSYVLALAGFVGGLNEVTLRLVCLLAASLTIPLFYLLGRAFTSCLAAVAGTVILFFSVWETEYARLILYYAPLQLVYVAGLYCFIRGYFDDRRGYRTAAIILFLLGPHIHQLALGLLFSFPALFLARGAKRFFRKDVLWPFGFAALNALAIQLHEMFFWKVGYVYVKTPTSLGDAFRYFFRSFSLDYVKEMWKSFPFMFIIVFAGLVLVLGDSAGRRAADSAEEERRRRWIFLNFCLLFPILFFGIFRTHVQPRYLFQLHPVFILLFLLALERLSRGAAGLLEDVLDRDPRSRKRSAAAATALILVGIVFGMDQAGPSALRSAVGRRYRDRITADIITRSIRFEHEDHRGPGLYVRNYLRPGDTIIAMHMVFSYIYAGRTDYWLWSGGPGTWDAWEKAPTGWRDVYIGARWLNTLDGLKEAIDRAPGRVWLIGSTSLDRPDHINGEIADFIRSQKDKLVFRGKDGVSEVYLWDDGRAAAGESLPLFEAEWLPLTFGRIVYAEDASRGAALELDPQRDAGGRESAALPGIYPPGRYRLRLKVKAGMDAGSDRPLGLAILATDDKRELAARFYGGVDLTAGKYRDILLPFFWSREGGLSLIVYYKGGVTLWLDGMEVGPADGT